MPARSVTLGRKLTEAQRKRWVKSMLETADEVGLPADPEFWAALVGYLEWVTRMAVINSQDGVPPAARQPADGAFGAGGRRDGRGKADRRNRCEPQERQSSQRQAPEAGGACDIQRSGIHHHQVAGRILVEAPPEKWPSLK